MRRPHNSKTGLTLNASNDLLKQTGVFTAQTLRPLRNAIPVPVNKYRSIRPSTGSNRRPTGLFCSRLRKGLVFLFEGRSLVASVVSNIDAPVGSLRRPLVGEEPTLARMSAVLSRAFRIAHLEFIDRFAVRTAVSAAERSGAIGRGLLESIVTSMAMLAGWPGPPPGERQRLTGARGFAECRMPQREQSAKITGELH